MCQTIQLSWLKTNSLIYNLYNDSKRGLIPVLKMKASLYWFTETLGLYKWPSDSSRGSCNWGNKPLHITYSTCPRQLLQYKPSNCSEALLIFSFHSLQCDPFMCIHVHICGGWRERRKASKSLGGLWPPSVYWKPPSDWAGCLINYDAFSVSEFDLGWCFLNSPKMILYHVQEAF